MRSDSKILIGAAVFYVIGYVLNWKVDFFNPMKQRVVGWNYLYIHEAVTVYSFYLLGIYFRRKKFLMENVALKIQVSGVIITFLIVLFTYKLNQGPFVLFNSVVIMLSSHGNFLLFPLTAVAGSVFILFLAKATPSQNIIAWLGQNALILFCLNGIFYHFINGRAAQWLVGNLSGSSLTIFGAGFLVTLASLALCIPSVFLFNKLVPQLVGKPKVSGPWLKNFI